MAFTVTGLTSGTDAVDKTIFTTASISPTANALLLLTVQSRRASGSGSVVDPTVTGNGLTWELVQAVESGSNRQLCLYRAMGAAPTPGTVEITFTGQTQSQCTWTIVEFVGADTSGTNGSGAIVQAPAGTTGAVRPSLVTLAAFASSNNMAYGANTHDSASATTPGSGFTEVYDISQTEVGTRVQNEYKLNETAVDSTWSAEQNWLALAVEIKAADTSSSSSSSSSSCRSSSSSSSSSSCRSSSSSSRSSSSASLSSSSCSSSSSCRSSSCSSSSSQSLTTPSGYYFSKSGSNTTGNGSQGNPWYQFSGKKNGVSALVPGEVCYFKRGDVWEGGEAQIHVWSSGTLANPIIIDAYGTGENPKFCGAAVTTSGWVLHIGSIYRIPGQTQSNLLSVAQGTTLGLCRWNGTNATLPEGTWRREGSDLYVRCWGNTNPATSSVRIGSMNVDQFRGLIRTTASPGAGQLGSYVHFKNLTILGANSVGFSASAPGVKFFDCKAFGCARDGLLSLGYNPNQEMATDLRWWRGEVAWNNSNGDGNGQGITLGAPRNWVAGDTTEFVNIHDNFMAGIDFLDYGTDTDVYEGGLKYCTFKDNGRNPNLDTFDPQIYLSDGASEIYCYGCVASGSGRTINTNARNGIQFGSEHAIPKPCTNIYIINNFVYNNHWKGIASNNANEPGVNNISNIYIINNTVITYLAGTFDMGIAFNNHSTTPNTYVMKNNLFISAGGTNNKASIKADAGAFLDSDYNLFYNVNASSNILRNADTPIDYTLVSWQAASGEDANSINANPLVVSISDSNPDVHLQAGSPAINAGVINAFTPPSWLPTDVFPSGGAVVGYATADGIIDNVTTTIDIGYHYPTGSGSSSSSSCSSSSSSSCRSSSSSCSSSCSSSSSCRSSSSSSSCRSSSSSSLSSISSSSCSSSSSSSSNSFGSSSSSSCSSSSSSCRSSSSCSSSSSSRSSSSSSSSSSCRSSSSSCRSSSSSSLSLSSSSSSFSQAIINDTGGIVKVSSTNTFYREDN